VVKLLLNAGANKNAAIQLSDGKKLTSLEIAQLMGHSDVVELLQ
jgi:ankyrin repeat protein